MGQAFNARYMNTGILLSRNQSLGGQAGGKILPFLRDSPRAGERLNPRLARARGIYTLIILFFSLYHIYTPVHVYVYAPPRIWGKGEKLPAA